MLGKILIFAHKYHYGFPVCRPDRKKLLHKIEDRRSAAPATPANLEPKWSDERWVRDEL